MVRTIGKEFVGWAFLLVLIVVGGAVAIEFSIPLVKEWPGKPSDATTYRDTASCARDYLGDQVSWCMQAKGYVFAAACHQGDQEVWTCYRGISEPQNEL